MSSALKITIETITPEVASRYLGTMVANRPLRQRSVERYAREMIARKWLVNGEAIKFDTDGRLVDGQHRMHAVITAGIPVQITVVRGVDRNAMPTLDTGIGRNIGDVLVLRGDAGEYSAAHMAAVGAAARWWLRYDRGTPTSTVPISHQELLGVIDAHASLHASVTFVHRLTTIRRNCVASVQAFVHAYASETQDREMADAFMQDLNDGAGLSKTSPIFVLRRRLVEDPTTGRIGSVHVLALTIKAWNYWVEGLKVETLVWRTGGTAPEDFPRFGASLKEVQRRRKQHQKRRAS
jgi:hypothetical protein